MRNFALHIDPEHHKEWMGSVNNTGIGLIIRSIKVDYKFVSFRFPSILCPAGQLQEVAKDFAF